MPRAPSQELLVQDRAAGSRCPGVLIADDMALILTLLRIELDARGFAVWQALDGDDALDQYRKHHDEIDLVLLDVHMPGRDGPHTLDAIRQLAPEVLACFMTGTNGTYTEEELLGRGAAWIFPKPFRPDEVADLLQGLLSVAGTLSQKALARHRFPRTESPGPTGGASDGACTASRLMPWSR